MNESSGQSQDILQAIDCNGSGSLDYTEFLAAMLDQKVYMQRDRAPTLHQLAKNFGFNLPQSGSICRMVLRDSSRYFLIF